MMRINIMIDNDLMTDVLKLTGIKSKREAVEREIQTLLELKQQEKILMRFLLLSQRPTFQYD